MPSTKPTPSLMERRIPIIIALFGLLFCLGNLWFTAQRSTIPRSLEGKVIGREIGREKHPGIDDVYWLVMDNGEKIHVDRDVYDRVGEGDILTKESWSTMLKRNSGTLPLHWSDDFVGMLWTMPPGIAIVILLTLLTRRSKKIREEEKQ